MLSDAGRNFLFVYTGINCGGMVFSELIDKYGGLWMLMLELTALGVWLPML
jgi:hypothetical protein